MNNEPTVHVVDDELAVRDALHFLLQSHGLHAELYASAETFLGRVRQAPVRGCIVLDVRMQPMSGLQLHDALIDAGVRAPVIFLTGHGDIPMAVEALHKGAYDFIEKPVQADYFVKRIERALAVEASEHFTHSQADTRKEKLSSLSSRELAVLRLVAAGKLNKNIADELCVAVRTVEVHRARALAKLGIRSAAEAATWLATSSLL